MSGRDATRRESSWAQFYQMINVQFPHAIVTDVKIRGGVLIGYGRINPTKLIAREEALEGRSTPDAWDDDWLRLWRFAQEIGDAEWPEVHFRDGSPQTISMEEPGHQYDGLEAIRWSPPNWNPNEFRQALIAA